MNQRIADGDRAEMLDLLVARIVDYAIFMLDVAGNVVTWNAGSRIFKGYAPEDIIGRHFSVLYPPEDVAAGKPERHLAIAKETGHAESEGWRVRQDGTRFWAHAVITAVRDADGRLRGYGKVTRDLTERRAAELALRASEELFRCCFDDARMGMLIVGLEGRLERVNVALCEMLGYRQEQLLGMTRTFNTHPEDVDVGLASRLAVLRGDFPSCTYEKRYLHASGAWVWVAVHLTLIRNAEGSPLRWIAQVQDITERRSYERRLEHMADHDPLTGLLNRRSFERARFNHVARTPDDARPGSAMMIDLDNFKYFNDSQGHKAGDGLIARIANGFTACVGDGDALARVGGDEFAVLLADADERQTRTVAEALLDVVRREAMPPLIEGTKRVTASIGIARFDDGEALGAEDIMTNADLAMYDAKAAGGDRWSRYGVLRLAPR